MLRRALLCLAFAAPAFAQETAPTGTDAPVMETVLVTGEQPGPGLWKVSKDGHELWILGTWSPLAANMQWHSKEAEERIAESQEVLLAPKASVGVGFFRGITLLPALVGLRKNGDGKTLADVLPPELYARWQVLKARYLPDDRKIERERPLFAAQELYHKAIANSGLTLKNDAQTRVVEIARRSKVKVTKIEVEVKLEQPREALRDFKTAPRGGDVECLRATMDRLDTDLAAMAQRANAWADGDLERLRELPYVDQDRTCLDGAASTPGLRQRIAAAREAVAAQWLRTIEAALARNATSFAVAPINQLTHEDGWLARLRANGYAVEAPDEVGEAEASRQPDASDTGKP